MTRDKMPLRTLVERSKAENQTVFGWREFKAIADKKIRPSYKSLSYMFGRTDKTMKAWLRRYDEEKK